jgi:hypothetical protein
MNKIRESKGFAYESRGRFYARITVAPQRRREVALSSCASLDVAQGRAHALQGLVNRLREAGEQSWIDKVLEHGAPADAARLAELEDVVAGIVARKIVRDEKPEPPSPKKLSTQTEAWLASVTSLYDQRTHETLTQYAAKWPGLFGPMLDDVNASSLARFLAK